jgi:hypothetical protein
MLLLYLAGCCGGRRRCPASRCAYVLEWVLDPHSFWLGVHGALYFFLGLSIMGRAEVCASVAARSTTWSWWSRIPSPP